MVDPYKPGDLGQLLFSSLPAQDGIDKIFSENTIFKSTGVQNRITSEEQEKIARVLGAAEKRHTQRENESDPNYKKKKLRIRVSKRERELAEAGVESDVPPTPSSKKHKHDDETKIDLQDSSSHGSDEDDNGSISGSESDNSAESDNQSTSSIVPGSTAIPAPINIEEIPSELRRKDTPERLERTVFVGNIPLSINDKIVTQHTVTKFFSQFGPVECIRLRSVAVKGKKLYASGRQNVLRQADKTIKDSVNAYVVFEHSDSAKKALASNGIELSGHHLRIDTCSPTKDPSLSIFIGNLPFHINEEEIRSHFEANSKSSSIIGVRIIRDRETQLGKGIGYVLFKDKAAVGEALRLDGSMFKNRELRVQVCGKRTKTDAKRREVKTIKKSDKDDFEGKRVDDLSGVYRRLSEKKGDVNGRGDKRGSRPALKGGGREDKQGGRGGTRSFSPGGRGGTRGFSIGGRGGTRGFSPGGRGGGRESRSSARGSGRESRSNGRGTTRGFRPDGRGGRGRGRNGRRGR